MGSGDAGGSRVNWGDGTAVLYLMRTLPVECLSLLLNDCIKQLSQTQINRSVGYNGRLM